MSNSSSTAPPLKMASLGSRCTTEHTAKTVLNFEMTNYMQLKGKGVGESVTSPVFRVGGYDWKIEFYPDGYDDRCNGNASCFLRYLGQDKGVMAKFSSSMLETKGRAVIARFCVFNHFVFSPEKDSRGHRDFVNRSKLEELSQLGDGCFTIRCVLTLRNQQPPPPAQDLAGHLESILRDGTGAFSVGGQEFRAHRALVAAQSPVFAAQLIGPMAEKDMRCVRVVDVEPAIFWMMLHYIYVDSIPSCDDKGNRCYSIAVMQHLLVAADRYGLGSLKLMCEDELCKRMDTETVMITYALANQHHCNRLKDACIEFISSKEVLAAALETDVFHEHFLKSCRPLSLEKGVFWTKGAPEVQEVDQSQKFKRTRTEY